MKKKVVLLVFFCLFFLAYCLFFCHVALCQEYLVSVTADSEKIGYFLIYKKEGKYFAEAELFKKLGFPCKEDLPLERLKQSGKYKLDIQHQILRFTSKFPKRHKKKPIPPDLVVTPKKEFSFRGIDYTLGIFTTVSPTRVSESYSFSILSKLWSFESQLFHSRADTYFNLMERDEKNRWLKEIQAGKIYPHDLEPIEGISISNEPYYRLKEFSQYTYTLTETPGSRVDVFRGSDYIGTYYIDRVPYKLTLPIDYGTNAFNFYVYTPTGKLKTFRKEIEVYNYFLRPEEFNYCLAIGRDLSDDKIFTQGRLSYGLSKHLTLEAGKTKKGYIRSYLDIAGMMISPTFEFGGEKGFEIMYYDTISLSGSFTYQKKEGSRLFLVGSPGSLIPTHPTFTFKKTREATSYKVQSYLNKRIGFLNMSLVPSITFEDDRREFCLLSYLNLPKRTKLISELSLERNAGKSWFDKSFTIERNTKWGYIGLTLDKPASGGLSLMFYADLVRFPFTTLNLKLRKENSFSVSSTISGHLDKRLRPYRETQRGQGCIEVVTYLDKNMNHLYDRKDELIDAGFMFQGKTYHTKNGRRVIWSLPPFMDYELTFLDEIDVSPVLYHIAVKTERASCTRVEVPYVEMKEIEGYVKSKRDGIRVILFKDGKPYRKMLTRFGGYYYFRVKNGPNYEIVIKE